ncbi:unnamed protein product [Ilex paraguariensis]|uniref:Uncharacterized protein n=1 Tax=Ilex paraguariensis TaxID=185542 RepID=A0ABC8RM31_9AQUA
MLARIHIQANDNCNVASNTTKEREGPTTLSPTEDDRCVKSLALEPHIDSSNGQQAQDVLNGYSDTHFELDYNQLLNKYYELEEQRQNILQQLNQFGSWEYQGSGSSVQCGTTSTYQEQQVAAAGASYPPVVCSYCPYGCHSLVAPCTSLHACSLSGPSVEKTCAATSVVDVNSKPFSLEDAGYVKMAMGATERALSSLKTKASGNDDVNTSEEKEKEVDINVGHLAQSSSSETDLTTVLNAWYLAGFYTGK